MRYRKNIRVTFCTPVAALILRRLMVLRYTLNFSELPKLMTQNLVIFFNFFLVIYDVMTQNLVIFFNSFFGDIQLTSNCYTALWRATLEAGDIFKTTHSLNIGTVLRTAMTNTETINTLPVGPATILWHSICKAR